MKWRNAKQSGNIEDRRGVSPWVRETEVTRADRQFQRVRDARIAAREKKDPSNPRAATKAGFPENSDMSAHVAGTVEREISRLNYEATVPHADPSPRRPNSKPRRIPGTGR